MKHISVILLLVVLASVAIDIVMTQEAVAGMGDPNYKPEGVLEYEPATKGKIAFGVSMFIAGILAMKYL